MGPTAKWRTSVKSKGIKVQRTKTVDRSAQLKAIRAMAQGLNAAGRGLILAPGELKSVDVATVNLAANTTGAVLLLNGVERGTAYNQRVGNQYSIKSISMKLMSKVTATTGIEQTHRIMLVWDKHTNATALDPAVLLTSVSVTAHKAIQYRTRFWVLMDKTVHLNGIAEAGVDNPNGTRHIDWYKKITLNVQNNDSNAATVADITSGSLYLIVIGTVAAGATAGSLTGSTRLRFSDN